VAYLAPALRVDGRIWGRLVAGDTSPRRFSAREIELAESIANVLAAALQNDLSDPARRAGALRVAQRRRADRDQTEVALLDRAGVIVWVNRAWLDFCHANGGDALRAGVGTSYLASCEAAGDPLSRDVAEAIRTAAAGGLPAPMRIVIPCHSPRTARWYDVLISSRLDDDGACLGSTVTLSPSE
jgi:PAS domain-containing protein